MPRIFTPSVTFTFITMASFSKHTLFPLFLTYARTYVLNYMDQQSRFWNEKHRIDTDVYKEKLVFKDKNTWRRFLSTGKGRSFVESLKIEELHELVSVKANEMDEPPKAPSSPWEPPGPSPIEPPKSSSASSWVGIRASRSKLSLLFSLSAVSAGRKKSGRMRSFLLSRPRWSWRAGEQMDTGY